jgi:cytidylate kinase
VIQKAKVVAIDGPSGSGKSTIAKALAKKLNLTYLDTGALYRSIAFTLDNKNIHEDDLTNIEAELAKLSLEYNPEEGVLIRVNGQDLTEKIREHFVSELASKYSKLPIVRNFLTSFQREFSLTRASVLEGRDIGTVIFPDAALKVFLTADPKVRANRRFEQLKELGRDVNGISAQTIQQDIESRDLADKSRSIAPLVKAQDAVEINTGNQNVDEILKQISNLFSANPVFK